MMDTKLKELKHKIHLDASIDAFNSLAKLKMDILSAIRNELLYANAEYKAIESINNLNLPPREGFCAINSCLPVQYTPMGGLLVETQNRDTKSSKIMDIDNLTLVNWESEEFTRLEVEWKRKLYESVALIREHLHDSGNKGISNVEVDAIFESLSKLQNAYFRAVEDREKNKKLWLRLKMYTCARKKVLHDLSVEHGYVNHDTSHAEIEADFRQKVCNTRLLGQFDASKTGFTDYSVPSDMMQEASNPRSALTSKRSLSVIASRGRNGEFSKNTSDKSEFEKKLYDFSDGSAISEIFAKTASVKNFRETSIGIYKQYGNQRMSCKIFNNIVDFLLHSLNLPPIDKTPIKRIMKVYGIKSDSKINFKTFSLLYWEVLHVIKNAIEVLDHVYPDNRINLSILDYSNEDNCSYVNIDDYFEFTKKLSSGRSCTKYVAKELETEKLCVVEILSKTSKMPSFEEISTEVEFLKQLNHQNVLPYIGAYHDCNNIYIVSELCTGGSLLDRLQLMSKGVISGYSMGFVHLVFNQMVEALLYIHCNNVIHGSLSLDKIMLTEYTDYPHIKIRDIGATTFLGEELRESALSRMHFPPEAFSGGLCQKSDIWSCGVILLFLIMGRMPYEQAECTDFTEHLRLSLSSSLLPIDENLEDLIFKLLSPDPSTRPTTLEIVTHPWCSSAKHSTKITVAATRLQKPIQFLMSKKKIKRGILKALESQDTFYVNRVSKVLSTLELIQSDGTVLLKDFERILALEYIPNGTIRNISKLILLQDRRTCSIKEFSVACKCWRLGEINFLWSRFKRFTQIDKNVIKRVDLVELLYESRIPLMPQSEICRMCKIISVDDMVHWKNFVRLFLQV